MTSSAIAYTIPVMETASHFSLAFPAVLLVFCVLLCPWPLLELLAAWIIKRFNARRESRLLQYHQTGKDRLW